MHLLAMDFFREFGPFVSPSNMTRRAVDAWKERTFVDSTSVQNLFNACARVGWNSVLLERGPSEFNGWVWMDCKNTALSRNSRGNVWWSVHAHVFHTEGLAQIRF